VRGLPQVTSVQVCVPINVYMNLVAALSEAIGMLEISKATVDKQATQRLRDTVEHAIAVFQLEKP
jgi:hypothetical protein